jgi:diphosphomevalonate decarboxylase
LKTNTAISSSKVTTVPVTAVAHANIALIKYWGKRDVELNLPAVGSISLTLDALRTETTLRFDEKLGADEFVLDGNPASEHQTRKVTKFLDLLAGSDERLSARIESTNYFPTGAGLASSASGFAALTVAAAHALGLDEQGEQLTRWARQGSGSAARSIYGGFVEMQCGEDKLGDKDFAVPLYEEDYWDVRLLIAITSEEKKAIGSTQGMKRTADTAPYYESWVQSSKVDLQHMREALADKDFARVGELTEHSCFKMHGLAMAADPPLLYWNAATVESIHTVWGLRKQGVAAYVTIDAGPQVKVLCLPDHVDEVREALESISGVQRVIEAKPGPGAAIKPTQ